MFLLLGAIPYDGVPRGLFEILKCSREGVAWDETVLWS